MIHKFISPAENFSLYRPYLYSFLVTISSWKSWKPFKLNITLKTLLSTFVLYHQVQWILD